MSEGGIILILMARNCSFKHTEPHKCDNAACIWRRIALRPHQSCRLYDDVPDRAFDDSKACDSLLSSMIGTDPIISLFRSYQKLSSGMRLQGSIRVHIIHSHLSSRGHQGAGKLLQLAFVAIYSTRWDSSPPPKSLIALPQI